MSRPQRQLNPVGTRTREMPLVEKGVAHKKSVCERETLARFVAAPRGEAE